MKKKWISLIFILITLLITGCNDNEPVLIGLSGELSGVRGELGIALRNGAVLAIEEINANGGINGRMLELIVKDDEGNPEIANEVDQELIDAGAIAIIGHVTSGQTGAVLDLINENEIILISGSSSSTEFSGKADNFFRVISDAETLSSSFAEHIIADHDFRDITIVYSQGNAPFVNSFSDGFVEVFSKSGGIITDVLPIVCAETACTPDEIQTFVEELKEINPPAVLAITSAFDLALLVQYSAQADCNPIWLSSTWAGTNELIEKGGLAADGIELVAAFHPNYPSEEYSTFRENYIAHFGKEPSLLSANGYTAIKYLAAALSVSDGTYEGLKQALANISSMDSIQGMILFDDYGDAIKEIFIAEIHDGKFIIIESVKP